MISQIHDRADVVALLNRFANLARIYHGERLPDRKFVKHTFDREATEIFEMLTSSKPTEEELLAIASPPQSA